MQEPSGYGGYGGGSGPPPPGDYGHTAPLPPMPPPPPRRRVGLLSYVAVALVAGVPQGLNNLANQNAVYYQADPARVGSSAGLLRTFFYLGAIIASTAVIVRSRKIP